MERMLWRFVQALDVEEMKQRHGRTIATHTVGVCLVRELLQLFKQDRVLGLISNVVDVDVPHDALLVDDEDCTLGDAFLTENVVFEGDEAVGPEIAQQRV